MMIPPETNKVRTSVHPLHMSITDFLHHAISNRW